jgi:ribosomal protein S18 acetylase RimI-like enzyme
MDVLKAKKMGEHLVLEVKEHDFNKVSEFRTVPYTKSDYGAFECLHNSLFPNTYYDAKTIMERLNTENILKVLKDPSGKLLGYAYMEMDQDMVEASIEYIGVSPGARLGGLGTRILREVVTEVFSGHNINEIRLTVDSTNNQAKKLYLKAGFKPKYILINYLLQRKEIE